MESNIAVDVTEEKGVVTPETLEAHRARVGEFEGCDEVPIDSEFWACETGTMYRYPVVNDEDGIFRTGVFVEGDTTWLGDWEGDVFVRADDARFDKRGCRIADEMYRVSVDFAVRALSADEAREKTIEFVTRRNDFVKFIAKVAVSPDI